MKTADKIASIAPQFRAAGVDLYVFYFGYGGSGFDPFKFVPDVKRDVILEKHQDSAFMSDIKIYDPDRVTLKRDFFHKILERSGKSVLLTCGFNLSACVKKTALDAKKHIGDVILLEDLAADGRGASESLTKSTHNALRYNGVHLAKSAPLLKAIQGPSGMSAPSRSVA